MARQITCPSGLTGVVRHLKGAEANLFVDDDTISKGFLLDRILMACWEETVEPGCTGFKGNWKHALTGDRYYAALQIRIETYGSEYKFPVFFDRLRKEVIIDLDLETIPKMALSADAQQMISSKDPFPTKLPKCGKTVKFNLQTGKHEHELLRLTRDQPERAATLAAALRIVEIEGVDFNDRIKFVDDLHMSDELHLLDAIEDVECGIETAMVAERRGVEQEFELPLATREFWAPRKQRPRLRV